MNCVARIKYAVAENMIPKETLNRMDVKVKVKEVLRAPHLGFVECVENDCDDEAKIKGRCPKHYQAWRLKHPDEVRHYHKDSPTPTVPDIDELKDEESKNIIGAKGYDIRLRAHRLDQNLERYNLLRDTVVVAKHELRSMQAQVFYFLREGLEKWEKEKDL